MEDSGTSDSDTSDTTSDCLGSLSKKEVITLHMNSKEKRGHKRQEKECRRKKEDWQRQEEECRRKKEDWQRQEEECRRKKEECREKAAQIIAKSVNSSTNKKRKNTDDNPIDFNCDNSYLNVSDIIDNPDCQLTNKIKDIKKPDNTNNYIDNTAHKFFRDNLIDYTSDFSDINNIVITFYLKDFTQIRDLIKKDKKEYEVYYDDDGYNSIEFRGVTKNRLISFYKDGNRVCHDIVEVVENIDKYIKDYSNESLGILPDNIKSRIELNNKAYLRCSKKYNNADPSFQDITSLFADYLNNRIHKDDLCILKKYLRFIHLEGLNRSDFENNVPADKIEQHINDKSIPLGSWYTRSSKTYNNSTSVEWYRVFVVKTAMTGDPMITNIRLRHRFGIGFDIGPEKKENQRHFTDLISAIECLVKEFGIVKNKMICIAGDSLS